MIIEQFNACHLGVLAFDVILTIGVWLILRKKSTKTKYYSLLGLEICNLLIYIVRILLIRAESGSGFNIWTNLPLYLCDFSLIVNLVALLTKNKLLYHYSYFIASIGGVMALLFPSRSFIGYPIFDTRIALFYLQHILISNAGILMYMLGFFKIDVKRIAFSNVFLFAFATICHFINNAIISNNLGSPNYMFTVDAAGIPILELFRSWIDVDLLYLLPSLMILAFTDVLLSLPQIIGGIISKKRAKAQSLHSA